MPHSFPTRQKGVLDKSNAARTLRHMYYASRIQRCAFSALLCLVSGLLSAAPIHQAIRAHDLVSLSRILERDGQDVVLRQEAGGVTALHLAAATDQPDAIKILLSHSAPLNPANKDGFTPLHWAASRNAFDAAKTLIEAGAKIDPRSTNGLTPLHFAAHKQNQRVVKLLLEGGADPQLETSQGYRPLHLALKRNPDSPLAQILAEAMVNETLPPLVKPEELPTGDQVTETAATVQPVIAEPMNEAVPGTFLNVPLGLGHSLTFVWIDSLGIWFGKYEITNDQFRRFKPTHSSRSYEGLTLNSPNQPAVYTSWNDAAGFCAWLNQSYSNRIPRDTEFRLPTENEWIYVASCGQLRQYPWGNQWPPRYGNYSDLTARETLSSSRGIDGYQDGHPVTCKVEDSGMNEWGVFGMAGNVWEWCNDWFDSSQRAKVRHGGSWDFDTQKSLTIIARGFDRPEAKYDTIGFRLVVGPRLKGLAPPEAGTDTPETEPERKWNWGEGVERTTQPQPIPEPSQPEPEPEGELAPPPLPTSDSEPSPWMKEPEPEPKPQGAVEEDPELDPLPDPPRLRKRDVEVPLYVIPHN